VRRPASSLSLRPPAGKRCCGRWVCAGPCSRGPWRHPCSVPTTGEGRQSFLDERRVRTSGQAHDHLQPAMDPLLHAGVFRESVDMLRLYPGLGWRLRAGRKKPQNLAAKWDLRTLARRCADVGLGSGIRRGFAGVALSQDRQVFSPQSRQSYIIDSSWVVVFGRCRAIYGERWSARSRLASPNKV